MSCWEVLVESIAVALIGVVTLVGVIASNSRSRAVMELKIDELTRRVEKHNCLIERTYKLEQDMAVVRRDVDVLEERSGAADEPFSDEQRAAVAPYAHGRPGRPGRRDGQR